MGKSKKDYSHGEFVEEYGEQYAFCPQAFEHGHLGHAWFNDTEGPGGGKNQWWWCRGVADYNNAKERLGDVGVDRPDPFLPHMFCSNTEVHTPHDWVWDDRPMQNVHCPGIQRQEAPEMNRADDWRDLREEIRSLPVRWADRAMFKAEPVAADEGPQVYLLWMTPDPLGAIAATCKMYKGEVVRSLQNISKEERLEYLAQVSRTKLKAPFEFVKFHFMIEGVSRSFTHQMVRQRTAAYAQESLRFAVKEDMPQYLPPSVAESPEAQEVWKEHNRATQEAYDKLINMGIPAEDARGRLPHDTLTRLHYTTDLRALLDHAGNRLCTQAQFEWRLVFAKILEVIRARHTNSPMSADGNNYVFMASEMLSLFKPVCYQTGRCEFKANFDRACSIRERVDAFSSQGIPPSQWEEGNGLSGAERIPGIKPGEWLLDHKAARRQ